jgi:nitrogen-specific signal transduction histidine kinase
MTRASGTGLGLAISYEIIQAHRQITATPVGRHHVHHLADRLKFADTS